VECPPRLTVPTAAHRALFMPARIAPFGTAMKVVAVPTGEGDMRGLPASTIVLDEETGAVRALVNASALTAYRTAAGVHSSVLSRHSFAQESFFN
jgi:ornithine cyclodeaminase/alanine dehydrogenase-like protein (mu-crystallin family)